MIDAGRLVVGGQSHSRAWRGHLSMYFGRETGAPRQFQMLPLRRSQPGILLPVEVRETG
jgi:hypothetical protein